MKEDKVLTSAMKDHESKIKKRCDSMLELDPKALKQFKVDRLTDKKVQSSAFTSPSRELLWKHDVKEAANKPIPT